MTPEKLLVALNDIDSGAIREAHAEKAPSGKPKRRLAFLIAAIIAITALTATAFAAEDITSWFREYFSKYSEISLTPGQIEYIEENEQIIAETQEHNGYRLKLKSVLSDSKTIYVTVGITAPTDLPFDVLTTLSSQGIDFCDQNRTPPQSMGLRIVDDMDGLETTADLVLDFTPASWNSGDLWTLHIEELCIDIHNAAYEQELLNTKYTGQENIMFTDEEAAKLHQIATLAEGPWKFTIDLSQAAIEELELITEPVTARSCYGFQPDGTPLFEEVTITSFILRPLGGTILVDYTQTRHAPDFSASNESPILAVMKDGSQVRLLNDWGMTGKAYLKAESPIILDEVDYILLADGSKLPAP